MSRMWQSALIVGALLMGATVVCSAQANSMKYVTIDQNVDPTMLREYHHTDQGTQIVPAAWLAVIERADGGGKFMSRDNLRRLGFL